MSHRRSPFSVAVVVASCAIARVSSGQEPAPPPDGAPAPPPDQPAGAPPAPDGPSGAEPAGADGEGDAGEDPSRPPPKGKGVVWGVVTDTKLGEPIMEGPVAVVGTNIRARTDIDGRFRIELPPGTYDLRVSYELHKSTRIGNVRVAAGQVVRVDAKLTPDESAVDVVEVVTEADRTSLEGQTLARQRAATVSDGVGRAEIARTPDRNAAEAARRVVGATIVADRFVYVRGLGERYTNATLNGSPLPSPEPDRNTVPLDLFPALVIDSITVSKTFTPDMPGDFAGGSVAVFTRRFPRETLFQASVSGGVNTATTFAEGPGYTGSGTDWLGFDGGTRSLPPEVPDETVDTATLDAAQVNAVGQAVNSRMSTSPRRLPPNYGASLVAGDSWKVGSSQKLGALAALSYGRSYQLRRDEVLRTFVKPEGDQEGLQPLADLRADSTVDRVRWGALATVTYELSPQHRISLTGFRSQLADDEAREFEGDYERGDTTFHSTRLTYTSRSLDVGQLRGEHEIPALGGAKIDWFGSLARAVRDQPDTRSNVYLWNRDQTPQNWAWQINAQSGSHFFSEQTEISEGFGLDWTQPLGKGERAPKLKVGGSVSLRDRDFSARRFELARAVPVSATAKELSRCESVPYPRDCPDKLFTRDNIGPVLTFAEKTQRTDAYVAKLDVYSAYVMSDAELFKGLRAVVGGRVEVTRQSIESLAPFVLDEAPIKGEIRQTDLLPALSLAYAATPATNVRLGVSRTLARPQLREIAPFGFNPYFGGFATEGNPDLELTRITNVDLRIEHFPTLREVLAVSVFYKHFQDPIEEVLKPRGDYYITYQNVEAANLVGTELEARVGLGLLSPALKELSAGANLTLAYSRVKLPEGGINTSASRPLINQSPYVVNVSIDYARAASRTSARAVYNVYGARIATVGGDDLPDIYEQPRHVVDLTIAQGIGEHVEIKGSAQNVFNAPVRVTQASEDPDGAGPKEASENVTSRYLPGATFTLSATYTY